MKMTPVALGAVILALLMAGCGGSDKKSGGTATDSKARGYAETGQALDAVCTKASAEAKPLSAKANGNAKHDAPLIEQLVAVNDKYIPQVEAIKPDPKLQTTFDAFVASLKSINTAEKAVLDTAKTGNDAAYQTAAKALGAPGKASDKLARALGANVCAQDNN